MSTAATSSCQRCLTTVPCSPDSPTTLCPTPLTSLTMQRLTLLMPQERP